jgi:hypothetical protein
LNHPGLKQAFEKLRCLEYDSPRKRWVWLYEHEARGGIRGRESFFGPSFGVKIATGAATIKKTTPVPLSAPAALFGSRQRVQESAVRLETLDGPFE